MSPGRSHDVPQGTFRVLKLECPNIFSNFSFRTYSVDQIYLKIFNFSFRTYSVDQIYLKIFQYSRCIENRVKLLRWSIFCKISYNDSLAVNYFYEITSSQKLVWVLNTPLILSSNVIWHAYRLIAETKVFRLGVSLICLFYVKEEWIVKKVSYRKI